MFNFFVKFNDFYFMLRKSGGWNKDQQIIYSVFIDEPSEIREKYSLHIFFTTLS